MYTVEQLMTAEPYSVDETESLADCDRILREHRVRQLPVVDDEGLLVGLVHDFDVQAAVSIGEEERTASVVMMGPAPSVSAGSSAVDALKLQLERHAESVVVVDAHRRPVGIITEVDGVKLADVSVKPWATVGEVATTEAALRVVTADDLASRTLNFMTEGRIRHVLVLEGERVVGVVSWRDVCGSILDEPVGQLVSDQTLHVAREDTPLQNAVRLMLRWDIGCLPVIDSEHRPVGILTRTDVLRALVEQLQAGESE